MNKLLIMIFLLGLFSCSIQKDQPSFYEVIKPEPIKPKEQNYDVPTWAHFDLGYDPLDFLIENPPLEIRHLYESPWMDKMIANRNDGIKKNESE